MKKNITIITIICLAIVIGIVLIIVNSAKKNNEKEMEKDVKEVQKTELYCPSDYKLNGKYCEKVIKEEEPEKGSTCPEGYQKVKDKCYKIAPTMHEPACKKGAELVDGKCIGKEEVEATVKCSKGLYNVKTKKCEVSTFVGEGITKCDATEELKEGKCVAADGTSKPASLVCPSGSSMTTGESGTGCYKVSISDPVYTCIKGTLEGDKCVVETNENPTLKVACAEGLTSYKDRTCLDYKVTAKLNTGLTCEDGARLEDDKCVYYEQIAPEER